MHFLEEDKERKLRKLGASLKLRVTVESWGDFEEKLPNCRMTWID